MNKELIEQAKLTDEEITEIRYATNVRSPVTYSMETNPHILARAVAQAQLNKLLSLVVKEAVVCPRCHGARGFVSTAFTAPSGSLPGWSDCSACHGTGKTQPKTVRDLITETFEEGK